MLNSQVSDSRALLATVQQTATESALEPLNPSIVMHIQDLLGRALVSLEQISNIIDAGLIKHDEKEQRSKLSWRMWIRNRTNLEQQTANLRQVRKELAEALTILTA